MDPLRSSTSPTRQTPHSPRRTPGTASPTAHGAGLPQRVYNAPGSPVAEPQYRLQETAADGIAGAIYVKLVKQQDLHELEKHIASLNTLMAADHALVEENDTLAATALADMDQQVSNVYLGKILHIICDLKVGHHYGSYGLSTLLEKCAKVLAARAAKGVLACKDLGIFMFHVGDLVGDAHAGDLCRDVISTHLGPQLVAWIKQAPHVNENFIAMAFMGCVRACENSLVAGRNTLVARTTVDELVEAILDKVPQDRGAFSSLPDGYLALCCRYGVQHLGRLGQIKLQHEQQARLLVASTNMARLSKLWIDEARMPPRNLWRAELEAYFMDPKTQFSGIRHARVKLDQPLQHYVAQAVRYYNKWLIEQNPERRVDLALLEIPRQATDNPVDGRSFSEVLVESAGDAGSLDLAPTVSAAEPKESRTVLTDFRGALKALSTSREDAVVQAHFIVCANELIVSLETGQTILQRRDEARILQGIDDACGWLADAVGIPADADVSDCRLWPGSPTASSRQGAYRWALYTYTKFMGRWLNRLLGVQAPFPSLPFASERRTYGLSPEQRTQLNDLIGSGQEA